MNYWAIIWVVTFGLHVDSTHENSTSDVDSCVSWIQEYLFMDHRNDSLYWAATGHADWSIFAQRLLWLGYFKDCIRLPQTQYCSVDMKVNSTSISSAILANQSSVSVLWGLCVSSQCNETQLEHSMPDIVQGVLSLPSGSLEMTDVHCAQPSPWKDGFYGTCILVCFFLLLCMVGTGFDVYHQYKITHVPHLVHRIDDSGPHLVSANIEGIARSPEVLGDESDDDLLSDLTQPPDQQHLQRAYRTDPRGCTLFCQSFSLVKHIHQLFWGTRSSSCICCLDGLRVLSMFWIILGHTQLGSFTNSLLENPGDLVEWTRSFWWQGLGSAYFAVDTFFLLSGCLAVYTGLRHVDGAGGRVPVLKMYLHRYIRLTPCICITMLLWIFVLPHMGSGPIWYGMTSDVNCQQYWWTNLLYIQNFYPAHMEQQCMGWLWYLALDFQYSLLIPVIVYCLLRNSRRTVIGLICICICSWLVTGILIGLLNIEVNLTMSVLHGDVSAAAAFEDNVYEKPYCRISPYIIGALLGYVLHSEKGTQRILSKKIVSAMWIVTVLFMAVIVWTLYPEFLGYHSSAVINILYGSLCHSLWAVAIACIIYGCYHGYAGVLGGLLEWSGWHPLSQLTFTAYLCHPLLMFSFNYSFQMSFHMSFMHLVLHYGGFLVSTYLVAMFLSLLVEMPLASLEKYIRSNT